MMTSTTPPMSRARETVLFVIFRFCVRILFINGTLHAGLGLRYGVLPYRG
jgi:hypothetical protein